MLELLVLGAGPHSLTCLLRLLEPMPDPSVDAIRRKPASKAALDRRAHKQRCHTAYRAAMTVRCTPVKRWCGIGALSCSWCHRGRHLLIVACMAQCP